MNGREQNTMHLFSPDGKNIRVKELVMTNEDYPSNMSKHVRDPKIYEKDGYYYMIQGGRDDENRGCVLLFQSDNLKDWKWYDTVYSKQPFGYMWECPDLFEIDGQQIMTCCPQGVEQQEYEYQNVYQCGYFPVSFDMENKKYEFSEFTELDKGFDIYATQTFQDEKGRRILIGWMGIPDADYDNDATVSYDWIHALTMPRELIFKDGKILQKPLKEMRQLRKNEFHCALSEFVQWEPKDSCFELHIDFEERTEKFFCKDSASRRCIFILGKRVIPLKYGKKWTWKKRENRRNKAVKKSYNILRYFRHRNLHQRWRKRHDNPCV